MGLLNHLFESTEGVAEEIELDDEAIIKHWKHYLTTVPRKKEIFKYVWTRIEANFQEKLQEFKKILDLELVDISNEEIEESEIISNLELMEHQEKIKRIHKLEQCLGYVETKYEYVYHLLHQLHSILKSQMHIVNKILSNSKDTEKLILHLKLQIELEEEIIKKIEKIQIFHDLFLALVKGEHIIKTMDKKEKRLLHLMQKTMKGAFSNEISEGVTYESAITVFNAIEDKVHEWVAKGIFPGYHPDIDFEYVNRPEFVNLVREVIKNKNKKKVSEQMINVFVHLFREWYNHERD